MVSAAHWLNVALAIGPAASAGRAPRPATRWRARGFSFARATPLRTRRPAAPFPSWAHAACLARVRAPTTARRSSVP
eukprot:scaffold233605_cov23-Tisochrysis_lutea.AAC.3